MTKGQKVVKKVVMGVALVLAFNIIICIIATVSTVLSGVKIANVISKTVIEYDKLSEDFNISDEISSIDIKSSASELNIYETDEENVKVVVKNAIKIPEVTVKNGKLVILEEKYQFKFNQDFNAHIDVYIPKDANLDKVNIETGVSKTNIDKLVANEVKLLTGVGTIEIDEIKVDSMNIVTGVGEVDISKAKIKDLDLEAGIGEINLEADITNSAKVKGGIGKINLDLQSKLEDYMFTSKGAPESATINGEKISSKTGNGKINIVLEYGIGQIKVKTK